MLFDPLTFDQLLKPFAVMMETPNGWKIYQTFDSEEKALDFIDADCHEFNLKVQDLAFHCINYSDLDF